MTAHTIRLSRIARVVNGGTPINDSEYWEGNVAWATPVDLGANHGSSFRTTLRTLTPAGVTAGSMIVPAGSVLISTRAPIGYVAVNEVPMAFNQGVKALVPNRQTHAAYLAYALQASSKALQSAGQGSTFSELSTGALASTRVPSVRLEQQRRIAEFLDRETAQIDELIAKQEQLICTASDRLKIKCEQVFAAQIMPSDRGRQLTLSDLGHLPRLSYFLQRSDAGTWGDDPTGDGDVAVLRSTEQTADGEWRIEEPAYRNVDAITAKKLRLNIGDLLITKSSGSQAHIGKATLVSAEVASLEAIYSNFMQRLRPAERLQSKYLWHFLRSPLARLQWQFASDSTTGLANLSAGSIARLRVPVPSLEEQGRLVHELDDVTRFTSKLTASATAVVELFRERRQALISAAVAGQIDVGGAS